MGQECTLKEAFIMKKLDELQPNWRDGDDVVWATKNRIKEYVEQHYSEILSPTESACLTFRSIEKTIERIRKKLNIEAKRKAFNLEKEIKWLHSKDFIPPVRVGLDSCERDICDVCAQENDVKINTDRHIELVPIACTNPECDKFALVTPADKRMFVVTYPLRKGIFVRPYCSEECQQAHAEMLKPEKTQKGGMIL